MSLETTLARVASLNAMLTPTTLPAPPPVPAPRLAGGGGFASQLNAQMASPSAAGAALPNGWTGAIAGAAPVATAAVSSAPAAFGGGRAALLAAVQGEVGQAEAPLGSNDSPRIAEYRTATAGSGVGPWCAYFVSWAAKQAGTPIGEQGQGYGLVDDVWRWAERTGKANPATSGQLPSPGDLIVWDEHIGVVEAVLPDGSIKTIEGNSSHAVSRRTHSPGSALGYVNMG